MSRHLPQIPITAWSVGVVLLLVASVSPLQVFSQDTRSSNEELRDDQLAISGRYDRFERLLTQMADVLGYEDPDRAELLRRAISKGREQGISKLIAGIAKDLGKGNLGVATEKQNQVTESLSELLVLLQSEDRRTAVERERERLNDVLNGVQDAINQQRSARARAQNSTAPSSAAPDQQQALKTADDLLKDIKQHDDQQQADGKGGQGQSDEGSEPKEPGESEKDSNSESESSEQKDPDSKGQPKESAENSSSEEAEGSQKDSKSQQSQSSDQQQSSSDSSQQNSGQQSESKSESKQTPGRKQIEAARKYMQEALKQLQQQERKSAVDEQDQSLEQLNKAADELEKELRQLREEEKEMVLAALEARFQRMLILQTQIYEGTLALAVTPKKDWLDVLHSQARDLSNQQGELSVDCSQTVALLREDGTSVSILVAVEDIEVDMKSSAIRLRDSKVGEFTQTLQTDVIESLKELIEATQREMQEMKSNQRQQQQQQGGEQKKPPLVEMMAEIKVLRSLQLRINRRTSQIDDLKRTTTDKADIIDLEAQLDELGLRQQRLKESAAELGDRIRKSR